MTNLRIIATTVLVMLPSIASADTGRFCNYLMTFGLGSMMQSQEAYSLPYCKKGDVVNIRISDALEHDGVAMYMAGEIAEICDNTLPVTIVSQNRAVCTYRGSRRSIRGSEHEAENEK